MCNFRNFLAITLLTLGVVMAFCLTLKAGEPRRIDRIIIHCSAVRPDQTSSARQIDQWHRAKGWKMIGYHYVIRRDGTIEKGRPEEMVGAHTRGYNRNSIAICYEGGLSRPTPLTPSRYIRRGSDYHTAVQYIPADTRTPQQKEALKKLIRELKTRYPHATIHGHNEFAQKACPCFPAGKEYSEQ